jgi:hypothetical protein
MLTCAIFVSVFASTNAEASLATYEKGDKWALKGEKDISLGYYSVNQLLELGNDDSWFRNGAIDNASISAYMSSVMLFEIVDVTDDEYVVKVTAAQNLSLDVTLLATGEIVEPGVYIVDWDSDYVSDPNLSMNITDADTTVAQVGVDAKLVAGANETYIVHMQKSDMAIKSISVDASVYARGHANLYNIPNSTEEEDIYENDLLNISSYESMSSNITFDFDLAGQMSFDPYVSMVKDGPEEDSTWEVDTYVNGSFSWTGMLDVTGLPQSLIDEIFDEDMADNGITGFPIDLAEIYDDPDSSPRIDNGTLAINAEEAFFEFSNLGNDVVNDPVYGNITIYRLGFNNATDRNYLEAWYYPAEGVLVGIELNYPLSGLGNIVLDMKSVSVEDAEKAVSNISEQVAEKKTYEQVNVVTSAGDSSNGLMDLLPYIIGLIAVVVVVVVAAVFLMKRKSKPKA